MNVEFSLKVYFVYFEEFGNTAFEKTTEFHQTEKCCLKLYTYTFTSFDTSPQICESIMVNGVSSFFLPCCFQKYLYLLLLIIKRSNNIISYKKIQEDLIMAGPDAEYMYLQTRDMTQKLNSFLSRIEINDNQRFLILPHCFKKRSFSWEFETSDCVVNGDKV